MKAQWLSPITIMLAMGCTPERAKLEIPVEEHVPEKVISVRTVKVDLLVIDQAISTNRLGAIIPNGQIYVLARDVVPLDHAMDEYGNDKNIAVDSAALQPGKVRLRDYKRPRPVALRANVGDTLEIHLRNLLAPSGSAALNCAPGKDADKNSKDDAAKLCATVQVMGLDWLDSNNGRRIAPGEHQVYRLYARKEGVFMLYSPNGQSIPTSQLDYGLFGVVNVQPQSAEWYRSQVTREDLRLASYRVSREFIERHWRVKGNDICHRYLTSVQTGLPEGLRLRRRAVESEQGLRCPQGGPGSIWQLEIPTRPGNTAKLSEVKIDADGFVQTLTDQPLVNYQAMYPKDHIRAGSPVLNMLISTGGNQFELAHSDLTAIITGPDAGRFPYYIDSPSFIENPASPDRRQPYREFTVAYHIVPNITQAFEPFNNGPLSSMLAPGADGFAINYGVAGIAPEIYANRANLGPMGFHKDNVDLLFEEFFLSSWAVGDPAMIVDHPANTGKRATLARFADDPSNVYHSYMRDHVKMRVLNAGSVAPHVHHQHAHQWLHSPDSDDGHYLDSQMINPGSTYTAEMTYNGSGNRNQTVGDSIFHCHIYPHFAQGMWSLWRVHDVLETGTELDRAGRPLRGARALPDGEIASGTPIPAVVPLPTLGMAPIPGKVRLSDDGRRAEVIPDGFNKMGEPQYRKNPGFPFFIPGVAGHRAPHPPLDFAWKEDEQMQPLLYSDKTAAPFRRTGDKMYLDGGLPRHLVLGGEVQREFHTRWDFTKELSRLKAVVLPEEGTAAEKVAMQTHATRSHASYQPDGQPGNFILNGLPPAPGAPYAAPEADDAGNSTANLRRYQAAVIQKDIVFNKEGWHYPQQRFVTLMQDVKPTVEGVKPPEPFFFRANTGETIEFWHTNLVPNYYELDDFQVRTPTDILGQHIHLVKFDVTASDGAGNGFNYEDGTFSPDEVRARIKAINQAGGLHYFDERTQFAAKKQGRLHVVPYRESYGDTLGNPPAGQDWDGAQTTVQRFDTDPLLNHQGEDRTLRTVFTHDHFGPSTHQQVGLYGALLVEPDGSAWKDSVTGCPMPDTGKCVKRRDGGPTSWQAIIETTESEESYREFAFAMADLQLAYLPDSVPARRGMDKTVWFPVTQDVTAIVSALNQQQISKSLNDAFTAQGAALSGEARVEVVTPGSQWRLKPNKIDIFDLSLDSGKNLIEVRTSTMEKSWADTDNAIWPPTITTNIDTNYQAPYPTVISNPGGSGNIGTWVSNYRNEPLDARITDAQGKQTPDKMGDPAFAYASIERARTRLNRQPAGGASIGQSGFRYPEQALVPEGEQGVGPADPYTPMARAYARDKVQVRGIVGAVDSLHSLRVQGPKWFAEPSYKNSGFRDVQGMGISEHFELIFQLPPGDDAAPFVDYLYAPSASSQGQAKGAWGIVRAYNQPVAQLQALPQNNQPLHYRRPGFFDTPAGAAVRRFNINLEYDNSNNRLYYSVGGKRLEPLVLRANAGDWIELTLHNKVPKEAADKLVTQWGQNNSGQSNSASYAGIENYHASLQAGINTMLLAYNSNHSAAINIGANHTQTVGPGESRSYRWYAGDISVDALEQKRLTPIEFGAVNLAPAGPLLQSSYGAYGALIIEPQGATWDNEHALQARIKDNRNRHWFTEVVIVGGKSTDTTVEAGEQVRFRVLNPNAGSPGNSTDTTHLITIEGHGWPEEPYAQASTVIGPNPKSQWLGTQQVTPLESYNLLLPSAGGAHKLKGRYDFYYYPQGPSAKLGSLTVK